MVKITVILVTKRSDPKFEWALESLKNQTYKDFEYIIIDGYYNRRNENIRQLIKDMNIDFPILYLPEKPSRWKGQRAQISNARNTGLIFTSGQYITFHDDCIKMAPNWLDKHLEYLKQGYIVASSWIGYGNIGKDGKGISGSLEYRAEVIKKPQVMTAAWFYCANCSFPLQAGLDINGFDEDYDGEIGQEDLQFGLRLERKGYSMMFDPTNLVEVYSASHYYDKLVKPIDILLKDGKEHFSNEWLTQKFMDDPGRILPYGNFFDLRIIRNTIKDSGYNIRDVKNIDDIYKMMEKWTNPDPRDWRDGKLIEEKISNEQKWE